MNSNSLSKLKIHAILQRTFELHQERELLKQLRVLHGTPMMLSGTQIAALENLSEKIHTNYDRPKSKFHK